MTSVASRLSLRRHLSEDRASRDVTSLAVIPARMRATADLVAQEDGVVSGVSAGIALARESGLHATARVKDGAAVRAGQVVLCVTGKARAILSSERTLVNLLMHLSGVATETRKMVDLARGVNPSFRIAATRKTLPGLRDLEKAAVVHGGGEPHRRDLSSAILLKGNHISLVGFERAIADAARYRSVHGIEFMVEVRSTKEAVAARKAGATRLLIDNLPPSGVRSIVEHLRSEGLRNSVVIEATGGITRKNVRAYALSGADLASSGHLTHSSPALAMHLVVRRPRPASGSAVRS